jgi:thiazole synthase ThiGH ThiG subunit
MAQAFKLGVEAGRTAHLAGRIARQEIAQPSSPVGEVARPV